MKNNNPIKITKNELDKIINEEIERLLLEESKRDYKIILTDPEGNTIDYEDTIEQRERRAREAKEKAIRGFQSYYRTLTTNQRYSLIQWLKRLLLNELNLQEIEEVVSRVIASSDGLKNRKNPLQKPK